MKKFNLNAKKIIVMVILAIIFIPLIVGLLLNAGIIKSPSPPKEQSIATMKSRTNDLAKYLAPTGTLTDLGMTSEACNDTEDGQFFSTWHTRLDPGRSVSSGDLDRAGEFLTGEGFKESYRGQLGVGPFRQWINKKADEEFYIVIQSTDNKIDIRPNSACFVDASNS